MLVIFILSVFLLYSCYSELGFLTSIGFEYKFKDILNGKPFYESDNLRNTLYSCRVKDGLFGELSELNGNNFTYSPYWISINRWLMAVILIAIFILIINRILVKNNKMPEYIIQIPVYFFIFLSILIYYLTSFFCGKMIFTWEGSSHFRFFITAGFALFAFVYSLVKYFLSDEKKKSHIIYLYIFGEIIIILATTVLWYKPYSICKDYSKNYGLYAQESHEVRLDLEKYFNGNFMNRAVETSSGTYFISDYYYKDDNDNLMMSFWANAIRKLDDNGNITVIYKGDPGYVPPSDFTRTQEFFTISYYDGYLYLSRCNEVVKMNPEDGSYETFISVSDGYEIADACVLEDRLYYMEISRDKSIYVEDEFPPRIWVMKLDGDEKSDPQIYLSDIRSAYNRSYTYSYNSDMLTNIITGENDISYGTRYMELDGFCYYLKEGTPSHDENRNPYLAITNKSDPKNPTIINQVGGYTIYEDEIIYVQLKDDGFDVCKCYADGSERAVLDTAVIDKSCIGCSNGYYQVIVGQGKILVYASGFIHPYYREDGEFACFDLGHYTFVTKLR